MPQFVLAGLQYRLPMYPIRIFPGYPQATVEANSLRDITAAQM